MRRAELLLVQVQRATENQRIGTQDGVSLEEYYQYFTDGLRRIQRAILAINPKVFRTEQVIAASGIESYALPYDMFSSASPAVLEYSSTGQDKDYQPLEKRTARERVSLAGLPSQYVLEGRTLFVNPFPAAGAGQFRLTYDKLLPALDKRRAAVASKTQSSTALTALTLSTAAPFSSADYALNEYLSIVDFYGVVIMHGIPYTAVNASTGVVSIVGGSYTFPVGSGTISTSHYATLGEYASTHFQIDDQCEDYLVTYCMKRIQMRDASADIADTDPELQGMLGSILENYAEDDDISYPPIINYDYWTDIC